MTSKKGKPVVLPLRTKGGEGDVLRPGTDPFGDERAIPGDPLL